MSDNPPKRVTHHGLTSSLVTSRKRRPCDIRDGECPGAIQPGDRYVRSVMFPNHDVYAYVDPITHCPLRRPIVHAVCVACAARYDDIGALVR